MKLNFYKEQDNRWYVDLPEFPGHKAELEMVEGADTMLDILDEGEGKVSMFISLEPFENANILHIIEGKEDITDVVGGRYYILKQYETFEYNLEMWLCDVTKFVFDYFPEKIYFKKI